ncbi:MAG: caspase family protein [Gemmataceae bacterium]
MTRTTFLLAAILSLGIATITRADQPGQTYGVLVGVRDYKQDLEPLKYTEADVGRLMVVLRDTGVPRANLTLLTRTQGSIDANFRPTADNIRRVLRSTTARCTKADRLIIALAGHGVQLAGDDNVYFCPENADLGNKASLISEKELYATLESCPAGFKLLLVDACRNKVTRAAIVQNLESVTRPHTAQPPGGTAAFFSCSVGERAFELDRVGHGAFFHAVIEGLKGAADIDKDGAVTLPELELYVKTRTGEVVEKEFKAEQVPELRNQTRGLVKITRPAGPARPWLGLGFRNSGLERAKQYGLADPNTPYATFLVPDSPAIAAGFKLGDSLLTVNGQAIKDTPHFVGILGSYDPGSEVAVEVLRDGRKEIIKATLAPRLKPSEEAAVLRRGADEGSASLQLKYADLLWAGDGVMQDIDAAVAWYKKSAAQGEVDAQAILGRIYFDGEGVERDYREALKWLRPAAAKNNVTAQNCLGLAYARGAGVERDPAEAVRWYRKAAEQDFGNAQVNLAYALAGGTGTKRDDVEAAKWYRKAADQKVVFALNELGYWHLVGRAVPKQPAVAIEMFEAAAALGSSQGDYNIGLAHARGLLGHANDAEAAKYFRKAADRKNTAAMNDLGDWLLIGRAVPKDVPGGLALLKEASALGSSAADHTLGLAYENGRGVTKDDTEATKWFKLGADRGHVDCNNAYGIHLLQGRGVAKNVEAAAVIFRKCAAADNMFAMNNLGYCYESGQGVPKDDGEAAKWYRKAGDKGQGTALKNLAKLTEEGRGVPKNVTEAIRLYRLAAERGVEEAKARLKTLETPAAPAP